MSPHPIVDKALEEGWPLSELIDVCEIFGYALHIIERGEVSLNKDTVPDSVEEVSEGEELEHDLLGLVEEYKRAPARARKRWTADEYLEVRRYWGLGLSVETAAERLGRTTKSIRHQYHRLNEEKEQHNDHDA